VFYKKIKDTKLFSVLAKKLNKYRLGDLLLSKGVINKLQLEYAIVEQKRTGEKLGKILIHQGSVSYLLLYYKLTEQLAVRISVIGLALFMQVLTPTVASSSNFTPVNYTNINVRTSSVNHYKNLIYNNEIRSDDISKFKKWNYMLTRYADETNSVTAKSPKFMQWKKFIHDSQSKSEFEKLKAVNDYFNKGFRYIEDKDNYNKGDYWATPIEFISRGGDCEDFAIAKYASLIKLGFNMDQLRISIVFDEVKKIYHAILSVRLAEGDFILDNQSKRVKTVASVDRYKIIFSINGEHWWLNKA